MPDNDCEGCGKDAGPDGLFHNDTVGLALCESCDLDADVFGAKAPGDATVRQLRERRVRTIKELLVALVEARDGLDAQIQKLRQERENHLSMLKGE